MAKKKKAEEHENLERWLVSYADFMTLLFATFVVLYALAQSDVNSFKNIADALNRAFNQNIFDNQTALMEGRDSILDGATGETSPLMLEYMSQRYEQTSYEDIKKDVEKMKEDGVSAKIDERGLVIRLDENAVKFAPGSAELRKESYKIISKLSKIIKERFSIHYIQVEGHTDSDKISSDKYPSNWELSSARASSVIRYMIASENFNPKLFIATGLADTIPIAANTTSQNKSKNRRVEIIILRNKNKHLSKKNMQKIMEEVKIQQKSEILKKQTPEATRGRVGSDKDLMKNVIDITDQYENEKERLNSLDLPTHVHDGVKPQFMEQKDETK